MRQLLPRFRSMCFIICLNCLVVPLTLRYWTCQIMQIKKVEEKTEKYQSITIQSDRYIKKIPKRKCNARQHVVFLKTHKTGGSTITNILNRYGEARDFNFILPRIGENRLDWPWFFQKDSFYPLNGSEPNILCNHARYSKETMKAVMPNDTIFVTILRHPITQFESSFSYMTLDKILGMENSTNPIEEFFKDPESVLVNYVLTQDLRINSDRLKLIRNGMFYDLGLESKDFENRAKISEAIRQIDSEFDLVMITEYFDESLVLLKRILCWELDDLVYFRLKQRTNGWIRNLSSPLKRKITHWSSADMALYEHFNRTFWKVIEKMGSDFWEEVKILKAKTKIMKSLCLRNDNTASAELLQTAETKQFKLRSDIPRTAREMCKRMTWDEIKYLKHLREIQIERIESANKKNDRNIFESFSWIAEKFKTM
ncbi:galactosylceramide sulfotransferase-like [Hydractinia symbiolongicarpus]|uniref:galactosylceramide sulfotransferase-like n=1 Tax=Hydractinia symbiolongicarpus TaxID=13093 RepID=UPI00254F4179|nr:galactosylceramide sulfotransferase-like [Hydractinia symbiolongicarpus]